MSHNGTVSVVIPVYNSEKFLAESIESVLQQTYPHFEIIAVNDGSTDGSLDILQQYSDKITILSQDNAGLASALNSGVRHMSGKWFKWFSPDDIMKPNALDELVNAANSIGDNCIVYSDWEIIDENGKILREFSESNYNGLEKFDFGVRLLDGQQVNVNTALIPSFVFENVEFENLDDPVAIDYDLFLKCALLYDTSFHLIQKPLIQYRIHSSQLSHKNITKTLEYLEHVRNNILSRLSESQKQSYLDSLLAYQKSKPVQKTAMEFGLKMLSKGPSWISDRILMLYLSKIRRSR